MAIVIDISSRVTAKVGCIMKTAERLTLLNAMNPQQILENMGVEDQFPIDIAGIIKTLGIKIIPYDFTEMEQRAEFAKYVLQNGRILGAVTATDDAIGIFYKKDDRPNRIRFTLAHELAHCCLHMRPDNYISHVDYRTSEKAQVGMEYDANVFAGELLMPEDAVVYAQKNLLVPYLRSLSKIFGVSDAVMKARLDYLDLKYIEG